MSRELPCPRCGQYDGEQLFNCDNCDSEFCDGDGCAGEASYYSAKCPDCEKFCDKIANLVQPEEAEDEEEESEESRDEDDQQSADDD